MIKKLQTETTWNIELGGEGWTVTLLEDWETLTVAWEVWDDEGEEYNGPRLEEIIELIESTLDS